MNHFGALAVIFAVVLGCDGSSGSGSGSTAGDDFGVGEGDFMIGRGGTGGEGSPPP